MTELADGFKYALLSLPNLNAKPENGAPLTKAEEGFALASTLPVSDISAWRTVMGWYRFDNLAEAQRYLVVYAPSVVPGVLNEENEMLQRRLLYFYLGVLIACPFIAHDESVFIEGARQGGVTDIRGQTTYPMVARIAGGPVPLLRQPQLAHALSLARAAEKAKDSQAGLRFGRVLTAFRAGLGEKDLDSRVHHFVRCVEAFSGSWRKEQFAENALELLAGLSREDLLQAYEIRSAVEHFGGWRRAINVSGTRSKEKLLIKRAVQLQAAAHYLIARFLERPAIWRYYANDASIATMRRRCSAVERQTLWGGAVDLSALERLDLDGAWEAMKQDQGA